MNIVLGAMFGLFINAGGTALDISPESYFAAQRWDDYQVSGNVAASGPVGIHSAVTGNNPALFYQSLGDPKSLSIMKRLETAANVTIGSTSDVDVPGMKQEVQANVATDGRAIGALVKQDDEVLYPPYSAHVATNENTFLVKNRAGKLLSSDGVKGILRNRTYTDTELNAANNLWQGHTFATSGNPNQLGQVKLTAPTSVKAHELYGLSQSYAEGVDYLLDTTPAVRGKSGSVAENIGAGGALVIAHNAETSATTNSFHNKLYGTELMMHALATGLSHTPFLYNAVNNTNTNVTAKDKNTDATVAISAEEMHKAIRQRATAQAQNYKVGKNYTNPLLKDLNVVADKAANEALLQYLDPKHDHLVESQKLREYVAGVVRTIEPYNLTESKFTGDIASYYHTDPKAIDYESRGKTVQIEDYDGVTIDPSKVVNYNLYMNARQRLMDTKLSVYIPGTTLEFRNSNNNQKVDRGVYHKPNFVEAKKGTVFHNLDGSTNNDQKIDAMKLMELAQIFDKSFYQKAVELQKYTAPTGGQAGLYSDRFYADLANSGRYDDVLNIKLAKDNNGTGVRTVAAILSDANIDDLGSYTHMEGVPNANDWHKVKVQSDHVKSDWFHALIDTLRYSYSHQQSVAHVAQYVGTSSDTYLGLFVNNAPGGNEWQFAHHASAPTDKVPLLAVMTRNSTDADKISLTSTDGTSVDLGETTNMDLKTALTSFQDEGKNDAVAANKLAIATVDHHYLQLFKNLRVYGEKSDLAGVLPGTAL